MTTIILSFIALSISIAMKYWVGVSLIETVALFFGLEGTVLLASTLSPPLDYMETANKKGIVNWFRWWRDKGKSYAYPIRYNPAFFYAGLLFLAIAMTLSAFGSAENI